MLNLKIACCSDKNFKVHLNVMLKSLECNLGKGIGVDVYVLYSGINARERDIFNKSLKKLGIHWIKVDKSIFNNYKIDRHITEAAYYRLLMSMLIPANIKKVIYLDSDIIVKADIGELWKTDIKDNYIGASYEVIKEGIYVSSPIGLPLYKKVGLNPKQRVFNTGVMVVNLEKWRRDRISERAMEFLVKYKDEVLWWDQDALNAVIAEDIYEIDPRWNQLTQLFLFKRWEDSPYDKKKFEEVKGNPYIIHYNTNSKPWHDNNNHAYKNQYFKYLNLIKK